MFKLPSNTYLKTLCNDFIHQLVNILYLWSFVDLSYFDWRHHFMNSDLEVVWTNIDRAEYVTNFWLLVNSVLGDTQVIQLCALYLNMGFMIEILLVTLNSKNLSPFSLFLPKSYYTTLGHSKIIFRPTFALKSSRWTYSFLSHLLWIAAFHMVQETWAQSQVASYWRLVKW